MLQFNNNPNPLYKTPGSSRMKVLKIAGFSLAGFGLFLLGVVSSGNVSAFVNHPVRSACTSYISLITDDKIDTAYSTSAESIKERQTQDEFKKIMSNLKHQDGKTAEFVDVQVNVLDNKRSTASCTAYVDNIQQTATNDRTDAMFIIGLERTGLSWKVSSVSVE